MLKGIDPRISPELLKVLAEMGHGDEIVIADGNFPSENYGVRTVRADGLGGNEMLKAILSLIPLDTYSNENFVLMKPVEGDPPQPKIWEEYERTAYAADSHVRVGLCERFAFYERAKRAFAVVATGEGAIYANIILKEGVVQ